MTIEFIGECYIGGRQFKVRMDRSRIGLLGWLALQGIGFAVMLVGDITVQPITEEDDNGD